MAQSIVDVLGAGSWDTVSLRLRESYIGNKQENLRRKVAEERLDFYYNRYYGYIKDVIYDTFNTDESRMKHYPFINMASSNNLTRRIIDTFSTVYISPPKRNVDGEGSQERYNDLNEQLNIDAKMRIANALSNLVNEVVLWPYIKAGLDEPGLEVITPNNFYLVADPWHPKTLLGIIIGQNPTHPGSMDSDPHFILLTPWETVNLNKSGGVILDTLVPHNYGAIPAVLVHREEPLEGLSNIAPGGDLIEGHKSYTFVEVLKLREQKAGGKQAVVATDHSEDMEKGQVRNDESVLVVPADSTLTLLDLSVDPKLRSQTQSDTIVNLSASYSIPPSLLTGDFTVNSGYMLDLLRQPLRERRQMQIVVFRRAEKELAKWLSVITREFDAAGWNIDFAPFTTPLSPMEEHQLFLAKRAALLTNTIEEIMRDNPDLTPEQAAAVFQENLNVETVRMAALASRKLGLDSTAEELDPNSPEQNGAVVESTVDSNEDEE